MSCTWRPGPGDELARIAAAFAAGDGEHGDADPAQGQDRAPEGAAATPDIDGAARGPRPPAAPAA